MNRTDENDAEATYRLSSSLVEALVEAGWQIDVRPPWCHVRTPDRATNEIIQGWKIHISATVISAEEILSACAPILIEAECEFKFAFSRKALHQLNDTRTSRGMSGKFITAYPTTDEKFRDLAHRLDEATAGRPGPRILSDAVLRPGSLVHYRFGAFRGITTIGNDGSFCYYILDPDGNLVVDRRDAVFSPPSWAVPPIPRTAPAPPAAGNETAAPPSVLLHDRYRISAAIRHANKGGVYLADDTHTAATVVIKEGRPHVATDDDGRDVRDVIRHEAAILDHLAHLGVTPRVVEVFTAQEHVFLAEEKIPGIPLVRWVNEELNDGRPLSLRDWWSLATKLTGLLAAIHGSGVIVRDFGPNNVMIDPDGRLRLIDVELAHRDGDSATIYAEGGTPGCSAPEQFLARPPAYSADVYSLGATLLFLGTATNPEIGTDVPAVRSLDDLVAARLRRPIRPFELPPEMVELLTGLLREEPAARPSLDDVATFLTARRPGPADLAVDLWRRPGADDPADLRVLTTPQWDELTDGIVAHLAETIDPAASRLWRSTGFGDATEPCAVQYGAGGVLAVLARLQRLRPTPGADKVMEQAYDWITGHLRDSEHTLPGLYFGAAGTALAVYDASVLLDRPGAAQDAVRLLRGLPRRWPNPDLTHGAAGLGTALLELADATGDPTILPLVAEVAGGLLDAVDEGGVTWTVPADFDSALAGYCSYGFAHGTAGIGAFLLAAGQALSRPDLIDVAERCGASLVELAEHRDGTAVWREGPDRAGFLTHWCNGASGVGTFLVRLYAHGGDPRYLDLADLAGRAVLRQRWRSGTAYCHGLAGDGDFLLDLADASGDPAHRAWAQELASVLYDRRLFRDGHAVIPNETGLAVTAEFGSGLAGHLAFLLRLRFGGRRMFHPGPASLERST